MVKARCLPIINVILLVTIISCQRNQLDVDISDIDIDLEIHRFDTEIFSLDFDTIESSVDYFYKVYGDFFDVFNVHVINIGPASDRYYGSYLSMFVNNPQNREVYEYVEDVFHDMGGLNASLENAFRHYRYHYPDSALPSLVFYVGGFNHKLFTVGEYIGVGLDQYLGRDCPFYKMMGTPAYLNYNKHPAKIPPDVAQVWGSSLYPYNDSVDNVLGRMIHAGQLLYFTDALMPGMSDSLKIGFSPLQMKFCESNEKQMWTYLIEHELLFSTDQLVIRKLTEDAPTTYYFPADSPGKAAVWLGWQIVREYATRHPELSVSEIMKESDYQKILRESRYQP